LLLVSVDYELGGSVGVEITFIIKKFATVEAIILGE
jgi:hypothetical protein